MPRKKEPVLDGDAIAKAIEKELPGWNVAKQTPIDAAVHAASEARSVPGTTLKSLRKKFFGAEADPASIDDAADSSADDEDYGALERDLVTVRIEPKKGGASKVADVVKGKVKIVQG